MRDYVVARRILIIIALSMRDHVVARRIQRDIILCFSDYAIARRIQIMIEDKMNRLLLMRFPGDSHANIEDQGLKGM
jgi:hypothetical protein